MAQHGRRPVSAKQARRTSQRMERSTIGTHASGRQTARRASSTGANVNFSNTRRSTRARRGEVNTITPRTRSGESRAAYSRRMNSGREVADLPRRRFIRGVVIVIIIIAVIAACWYIIANDLLSAVLAVIIAVVVILVVIAILIYAVFGTYYFFKKKDKPHNEYTSTLGDIQEVDREMNKDKP